MSRIGAGLLLHGEVLSVDEILARVEAVGPRGRPGGGRPVGGRRRGRSSVVGPFDEDDFDRPPRPPPSGHGRVEHHAKVGVVGAGGRMGREVCRAVSDADDLELVAAVDPGYAGEHAAGDRSGGATGASDVIVGATSAVLRARGAEVVVDFTGRRGGPGQPGLLRRGGHPRRGRDDRVRPRPSWPAASNLFAGLARPTAIVAANFAIGAVLMMRFAELAAPHMRRGRDRSSSTTTASATHRRARPCTPPSGMAEARARAGSGPWPGRSHHRARCSPAPAGGGPRRRADPLGPAARAGRPPGGHLRCAWGRA